MKQLEPGIMCRVVDSGSPKNVGKIVTLVSFVSIPSHQPLPDVKKWAGNDWWEVDQDMVITAKLSRRTFMAPYIRQCSLQPIDHRPADEDFRAEFKRMINPQMETTQ